MQFVLSHREESITIRTEDDPTMMFVEQLDDGECQGKTPEEEEKVVAFSVSPFESLLGSEALTDVLSYCDFPSALLFSRATSRSLRQDLYHGDHFLWKEMFQRNHFSLPLTPSEEPSLDYIRETQKRRQLGRNLLLPRNRKAAKSPVRSCCFNLPNRCFSFVPITPDGMLTEWDDPPPVDFGCDSFILTSTACGGEIVALDPFHGTLAVYESCLDNSVASDELMMEQAMLEAANLIDCKRENPYSDEDLSDEDIAGAAFDQRVYRNHNVSQYNKPPFQVLFRLEEDIDLDACFPRDDSETTWTVPPEIDVGYHGIDTKCILENGQVAGCMIAVGRMFTKEARAGFNGVQQVEEQVCTELHMWTRRNSHPEMSAANPRNHTFGSHKICRFPCSFQTIDLCATHGRIFVSFEAPRDGSALLDDGRAARMTASTIVVYPMTPYQPPPERAQRKKKAKGCGGTKYQEAEFMIQCQSEVSSLAVDPTGGTLVVGTASGTCEVWIIKSGGNQTAKAKRTAVINIKKSISTALRNSNNSRDGGAMEDDSDSETVDSIRMRRTLLSILNSPKIVSFHHPNHLPFSACGFVTLQHSSTDGSSLLLWRKSDATSTTEDSYKIVSMINLPLSATTRAPRVFYDGRRILIFGQDHIGLIVLVYQVLASNEDIYLFQEKTNQETSGGVYNLTFPPRARFANRIRHVALGGLQYYDSIHMTANDRFIVVNTKSGNLLSGSTSPFAEGLLVFDLQD